MATRYLTIALLVIIISIALGLQSFLPSDGGSDDFQARLSTALSETESRYNELAAYLDRYLDGKKIDVDAMKAQRDLASQSALEVSHCLRETSLPSDKLMRDYLIKFKANFYNLSKMVKKFKEVIAYISEHNPGKDADFVEVVRPLNKLAVEREKLLKELMETAEKIKSRSDDTAQ